MSDTSSDSPVSPAASMSTPRSAPAPSPTPGPTPPKRYKTPRYRPGSRYRAGERVQHGMVELRARGESIAGIARQYALSQETVRTMLKRPENQAELAKLREDVRQFTLHRMSQVAEPAWDLAEASAKNGDAKSFDAAARGLHALEKVSSSVSGEGQRISVEHTGHVVVDHRAELRALLAVITGKPIDVLPAESSPDPR